MKANNPHHVRALADLIQVDPSPAFAAHLVTTGVMLCGPEFDAILDMVPGGKAQRDLATLTYFQLEPEDAEKLVDAASLHALEGSDSEDADSVGGFSQRETDLILSYFRSE